MEQLAELLLEEPEAYQILLKDYLKQGMSFPRARQEAILSYTEDPRFAEILRNPNNILGIEYLKAIKKLGSRMEPYTIARRGAQYHEITMSFRFREYCQSWKTRFQNVVWNF